MHHNKQIFISLIFQIQSWRMRDVWIAHCVIGVIDVDLGFCNIIIYLFIQDNNGLTLGMYLGECVCMRVLHPCNL